MAGPVAATHEAAAGRSALDVPIFTDRLVLRPHRMADLDDLVRFHGDPDVVRYLPWPVRDRAATEQALRMKLGQGARHGARPMAGAGGRAVRDRHGHR